ncbi:MAG TPA: DUF2232 domain-containing protein [Smithellaceae bacterium]|nr:DUF2232 domain-containing protein [Smithellaceae bacterium]
MSTSNLLTIKGGFWRLLLVVFLYLSACLLPLAGLFFVLTLPTFMFLISVFNGWAKTMNAFFTAIVAIFAILSFTHTFFPLLVPAAAGLSGMVMARSLKLNPSIEALVLFPSLVCLAAITAFFVLIGIELEMNIIEVVKKYVSEAVDLNIGFYARLPLKPEEIKAIQDSKDGIIDFLARLFPAICTISVLSVIWLNVLLIRRILGKKTVKPYVFSGLSQWKTPPWLVWVFIAAAAMIMLSHTYLRFAGINIFLVVSFLYLLQGLAIVSFFFQSKNISMFFRVIIYFLIAVQQLLMVAIALVGLFDLWVDFRKYFRKDQATG